MTNPLGDRHRTRKGNGKLEVAVTAVLWFRRDLRLHDHPALAAAASVGPVVPLFVLDPRLLKSSGPARITYLLRTLHSLRTDLRNEGADLVVRRGDPAIVVPSVAAEVGAHSVHVTEDFAPYGVERDAGVAAALGSVPMISTGSPYLVAPGQLRTRSGGAFEVFAPFYRAWLEHPRPSPDEHVPVDWRVVTSDLLPNEPLSATGLDLPAAGEDAALETWAHFRRRAPSYGSSRDCLDRAGTTGLSPYLKFGSVHPRTLLATMAPGERELRRQLAWREFFAAALFSNPTVARRYVRDDLRALPWVTGTEGTRRLSAWKAGRTGYPLVDAAMRQLRTQGRIHNRSRMVAASFLVKDLGIEWTHGASFFLRHLIDGDVASNQLSWQWVAGTGFDAAPYFRIFNPVRQSRTFDPSGAYLRRWLPELRDLDQSRIHEPWTLPGGPPNGYPNPIVDHETQRRAMVAAYGELRKRQR